MSKTLTRPDLSNLSAAVGYDFRPTDQTITKGNAELKPYLSKNLDLGLEWYFADTSYVSLDTFYKKVDNFSTLVTSTTEVLGFPFLLTEPVNLNSAAIKGAEFTFNYQFTHLPSPFDGLGVATNYTYVTSSASASGSEISTTGKFAIPGIGNSSNASLFYQKGPVELRLAYNWRQAYLNSIAGAQGQPTTVKSYGQLDFSGTYHLNKNVSFYLQATNLNNEKIYQYQVYLDRESYAEADGRTIAAGVHIDWK
ncbi:TonB-dependent receptor [Dyella terrae]|nr:TonB-dependent receptor [Dyella terrae]